MKTVWKNGVVILLVIAVLYIIFLRECKRPDPCPAEDEVIIKKSDWQSMIDAGNKPAKHDTVWIKGDIVYVPTTPDNPLPQPKPEPKDTTINKYSDSLIKKDINVNYSFQVRGELLNRTWTYNPIITRITDSIPYAVPVEVLKIVKQPARGLFVYGTAGGNADSFLFGGGLDFITKKNTELGYMYQRFGPDNIHSIKLGVKLFK